ncbi:hypothetical protein BGZ63DRAFT_397850 [Mariannaea sp. PMI_226]|nr:hypothetical protein BGZ63DRAFT_397850 [Mariannaea sp. PMI_226]
MKIQSLILSSLCSFRSPLNPAIDLCVCSSSLTLNICDHPYEKHLAIGYFYSSRSSEDVFLISC